MQVQLNTLSPLLIFVNASVASILKDAHVTLVYEFFF